MESFILKGISLLKTMVKRQNYTELCFGDQMNLIIRHFMTEVYQRDESADEMEVKHGNNIFYVGDNQNELLAAMTFVPSGNDKIIIDHTEVSDELRGQNVGDKLLESLVEYSRENKLKI